MDNNETERFESFGKQLDELASKVDELKSNCKETLRIDRKLDYEQTWAIHHLSKAIATELGEAASYDKIEMVLTRCLLEQRLELKEIKT